MTVAYTLPVTCPECGGHLEHRDSVRHSAVHVTTEAWCEDCMAVVEIVTTATVRPMLPPQSDPETAARRRAGEACTDTSMSTFQ